jgi:hypothetical protein
MNNIYFIAFNTMAALKGMARALAPLSYNTKHFAKISTLDFAACKLITFCAL